MRIDLPEDIADALQMLETAEQTQMSPNKIEKFKEGIELLCECSNDYPEHGAFIKNQKFSYTRSILDELYTKRPYIDPSSWTDLFLLFISKLDIEIKEIIRINPRIGQYLEEFLALWGSATTSDYKDIVNAAFNKSKKGL